MKLLIGDFLSRDSAAGKHVDDNGRSAVQQQSLLALMDGGEIFLQEICPPHNSRRVGMEGRMSAGREENRHLYRISAKLNKHTKTKDIL